PWQLHFALLGSCIPQTLSQFVPAKGDPIPAHFNRHASLHSANPTQYTEANMLLGAILVTAFLREIDELQGNGGWDYLTKRGAPTWRVNPGRFTGPLSPRTTTRTGVPAPARGDTSRHSGWYGPQTRNSTLVLRCRRSEAVSSRGRRLHRPTGFETCATTL